MGKYGTTTTTTWNINPRASNTGNLTAFGGDSSSSSSGQESQAHYIIGAQTACMVVALVLVALRTYTRTIVRPGNFGWEDVLLVASMAAFVLESACVYQSMSFFFFSSLFVALDELEWDGAWWEKKKRNIYLPRYMMVT